jgi:GDP-L-fucose synthase
MNSSVSPEDEVSIKEVAESIRKAVGLETPLVWDSSLADGQYKKTANNSKLQSLCPGFSFTPLDQGVQESVNWFLKNYPLSVSGKQ